MNTKVFNLTLMVLWLLIGIGLWTRDWWMPPALFEKVSGPQTPLVIAVAFVLAVWNVMRYWVARQYATTTKASPEVEAMRQRIRALGGSDPKVTDPQFDFDNAPPTHEPR